jgi:hypothetical protein
MAYQDTVLSLNPDGHTLLSIEVALRENGFEVITVPSPLQARFEIEMGRCGIFLTSYITPVAIYRDLANLFRQSCPAGSVVYVAQAAADHIPDSDILLSDRDEPRAIIQKIHLNQEKKVS